MAIVQISKIQQRSGNLVDLPQLDEAELGFASDEKLLYIGVEDPPENVEVLTSYSNISFSQLEGSYGNLEIDPLTAEDGQVLAFDGNNWVNRGGNSGGLLNLGEVSNVKIEGGGIDYVLTTDGTGNLSWTAKGTIVTFIQTVSKANPGIVTTTEDNFLTEGAEITITNPQGMTQLAGGVYYANILTSNTFALYSDTGLTTPVDTSGFSTYAYTSVTATTAGTNDITVGDASLFAANNTVKFIGTTFGGIDANTTYYILTASGTTITISTTQGGSEVELTTDSGTCNVYATGGRVVSELGGGTGTAAQGSNLSVQYNNNNLLDGDPDFTWNFTTNTLTIAGNANATNVNATNVVTSNITGVLTVASNAQPNVTSLGNSTVVTVAGNLNPSANITYSLGNSTNRWTDVYLANLVIGTANITSNALGIFIDPFGGLINGNSNILMAANGNINMSVSGNANIFRVTGTGANITGYANITGNANIGNVGATNGVFVSNVTAGNVYANSGTVGAVTLIGSLATAAQPNVTSLGTLVSLSVTGNVTAGNVYANSGTLGASLLTGTLTTAAQPNVTSLGTLTGLGVNGTVTAVNFTANTGVFTGNGSGLSALNASNLSTGTVPSARLSGSYSISVDSATTAGTVTTAAQPNITSLGTLSSLAVTGNVTAGNVYANSGTIGASLLTGTLTTAAQPNVTSVGTLTSLTVSANTTTGGIKTDNYYYANGVAISFAGTYSNSNVASYLTVYNGSIGAGGAEFFGNRITTGSNTNTGTITGNWTLTTGSRLQATYADLAEYYSADKHYPAGTVLAFGGEQEVTLAGIETNRVAGIVSSDPAYVMNGMIQCAHPAVIALQGRVPCKVRGKVYKGDMMISAGDGYAKAAITNPNIGTVIGKALQNFDGEEGVIEVAVGRL